MNAAVAKKKKPKKKMTARTRNLIIGGVAAFVLFLVWFGSQPIRGTILYGICKVYIELDVTYPDEVRYTFLTERREFDMMEARVGYIIMNEFGEYQSRTTQCFFGNDAKGNMTLARVVTDRMPEDAEKVKRFNTSLSTIATNPPDLTRPPAFTKNLNDLWRAY